MLKTTAAEPFAAAVQPGSIGESIPALLRDDESVRAPPETDEREGKAITDLGALRRAPASMRSFVYGKD